MHISQVIGHDLNYYRANVAVHEAQGRQRPQKGAQRKWFS